MGSKNDCSRQLLGVVDGSMVGMDMETRRVGQYFLCMESMACC